MKPPLVALSILVGILVFQAVRPGRPRARGAPRPDQARATEVAPRAADLLFAGRLDLNQASAADLEALPGIGPARAEAIVRLRQERGRFVVLEELLDVPGIGPKTLERLRPRLQLTADPGIPQPP